MRPPRPVVLSLPGAAKYPSTVLRICGLAFVIALTGAVTPGPLLALVVGQVLAQGPMAAPFVLLGHALIEAVFVLLLAFGLGRVLQRQAVRGAVGLVGGAVLVWMGQDILRHVAAMSVDAARAQPLSWPVLVAAGVGVSLSNPYFTGWWATVGTGQVAALRLRRLPDWLAFYFGHEMGDVAWYMAVAAALTVGATWITGRAYQVLVGACGTVMVLLGLWFLFTGVRFVLPQAAARKDDDTSAPKHLTGAPTKRGDA